VTEWLRAIVSTLFAFPKK